MTGNNIYVDRIAELLLNAIVRLEKKKEEKEKVTSRGPAPNPQLQLSIAAGLSEGGELQLNRFTGEDILEKDSPIDIHKPKGETIECPTLEDNCSD